MLKKGLDTNITIYSLIENHPASKTCEEYLKQRKYGFYITPITPFEVYFVLRKIYAVKRDEALNKALSLFKAPIEFLNIDKERAEEALKLCGNFNVSTNDSFHLQLCLSEGISTIASDDSKFLETCEDKGILLQTPINEDLREKMNSWEKEKLPPKGLPRILRRIHAWLEKVSPETATKFFEATGQLKYLPLTEKFSTRD